ncbi:flavin reductase family protein [Kitasatospora sp. NPDC092948]|uniref:flavin reductase family protein n=1 Tax=Kitasatospora sp. NPDC092948 TaxID=3364088 RepID=UPI00380C7E3F
MSAPAQDVDRTAQDVDRTAQDVGRAAREAERAAREAERSAAAALGQAEFRAAARNWPTGVAVLTARWAGIDHAKTVSSFSTLSLDPLLIGVAVSRRSPLTAAVRASGRFTVAVLGEQQAALARRFATPGAGRAPGGFADLPLLTDPTGEAAPAGGPAPTGEAAPAGGPAPTGKAAPAGGAVPTGGPVPAGVSAWFDARLYAELPVGDHLLLVGEALAVGEGPGLPLLHHAAHYRRLGPELPPTDVSAQGVGA